MKILIACAHRHLILFRPLQNSLAPQLWKRYHQVLPSFRNPTVLQQGGSPRSSLRLVQPRWLGNVASSQREPEPQCNLESSEKFTLIYKLSGIRLLKFLSRLKVLQTALGLVILPLVWYFHVLNKVTLTRGLYITGVFSFSVVLLYGASFFLQRVIGFIYLNKNGTLLKVSHLTFWGKRRNFYCPVESVVTLGEESSRFLLKFRQYDQKEILYFSLSLGQVMDHQAFDKVFGCYS